MSKICMFGISGSGKTCYLYAMAQVMNNGVRYGDSTHISVISNDLIQQQQLYAGYNTMAIDKKWPSSSSSTTDYDFKVRVQHKQQYWEIIPSLIINDYAGGTWTNLAKEGADEREKLLTAFFPSDAILFIMDSDTILKAMADNLLDIDESHRERYAIPSGDILRARQQVSLIQNLLDAYKTYKQDKENKKDKKSDNTSIPPILVVITKGDLFASLEEKKLAYKYLIDNLPSLFAQGSQVEAAITTVALGETLKNTDNKLDGKLGIELDISTRHNIQIPMLYALYAYLSDNFDGYAPDEQEYIDDLLSDMRKMMGDNIVLYRNGYPLFAL